MTACGTSIFTDPMGYQAGFRGAGIKLVLTAPGIFKTRLTWVDLPNLRICQSQENSPRIAVISPALKRVCFAFPTQFDTPMIWSGAELQPGDVVFLGQGKWTYQRTTGASAWAFISLARGQIDRRGRAACGVDLLAPSTGRVLRLAAPAAARLLGTTAEVCRLAETESQIIVQPQVARAIEQDLLDVLVSCPTDGRTRDARHRHCDIMLRFEDLLTAHLDRQLPTSEICASVGISERTLRVCCSEFPGMGPSQYMRLRRLNLAGAELRCADPSTGKIADIAGRHGFSELGRFAVFYRTIFGERPSATLRRPRSNPGSRRLPNMHSRII
jgi:AraC-like DNA-binding protein